MESFLLVIYFIIYVYLFMWIILKRFVMDEKYHTNFCCTKYAKKKKIINGCESKKEI